MNRNLTLKEIHPVLGFAARPAGLTLGELRAAIRRLQSDREEPGLTERAREVRAVFRTEAAAILRTLRLTEQPYRMRLAYALRVVADEDVDRTTTGLLTRRMLLLIRRLARRPFAGDSVVEGPWLTFCQLEGKLWHRFLNAGPAAFLALDRACERAADARLVEQGLRYLNREAPEACVTAFQSFPVELLRAARALGRLPAERSARIIQAWLNHPLSRLEGASLEAVARTVAANLPERINNPIPNKLKAYLAGTQTLKPGQVERMQRILQVKLHKTRLDLLKHLAKHRPDR
ncbi:MAG: hypothetical protein QNK37_11870 [Acidobacteriota bacterium]|nr:hypothetical protein [Acidobacteriota bacterium]